MKKRLFDLVGASLLFLFSLPLLAAAAIAVRFSSRGPVFFGHERVGRGGEPFRCLKLRTMVPGAEEWLKRDSELKAMYKNNGYKLPRSGDPRVTAVGRLLRFTHLDELPQLVNVLRGDMSLVGPRPLVEDELEWYGDAREELLSVRPGIFGPWTGQGKARPGYPERAKVELGYVQSHCLVRDLAILMKNVPVILTGQVEEDGGTALQSGTLEPGTLEPGTLEEEARS